MCNFFRRNQSEDFFIGLHLPEHYRILEFEIIILTQQAFMAGIVSQIKVMSFLGSLSKFVVRIPVLRLAKLKIFC